MEPRVSFITLGVAELTRATRFYVDVLELELLPSSTAEVSFFAMGATWLALYPRQSLAIDAGLQAEPHDAGQVAATQPPATFALAHNVSSRSAVDALLTHVARHADDYGCRLTRAGAPADWGGYTGYFADPDGFLWEVAWNPDFALTC